MGSRECLGPARLLPTPHSLLPCPPCPQITIYTTPFCPYCHMAKRLLAQKGASFEEIDVTGDWAARDRAARQGRRPHHRAADLDRRDCTSAAATSSHALERAGKLDALLAGDARHPGACPRRVRVQAQPRAPSGSVA